MLSLLSWCLNFEGLVKCILAPISKH
uniref:Uncharacterized protein n=1 Tax=Anguilla anguilla TaxID=7936 RepID=A0A0E9VS27_ANGAN